MENNVVDMQGKPVVNDTRAESGAEDQEVKTEEVKEAPADLQVVKPLRDLQSTYQEAMAEAHTFLSKGSIVASPSNKSMAKGMRALTVAVDCQHAFLNMMAEDLENVIQKLEEIRLNQFMQGHSMADLRDILIKGNIVPEEVMQESWNKHLEAVKAEVQAQKDATEAMAAPAETK
jgi:hypothetical protein